MLVTHSGRFHADEVFATAMVLMVQKHEIIRTRDETVINQAEIVLDVGAEYNPEKLRFDHHQNSFVRTRKDGPPFATAGLIWEFYGSDILKQKGLSDDYEIQFVINRVDAKIIADIDAVDNGLFSDDPRPSISLVIAMMNQKPTASDDEQLAAFFHALTISKGILNNFIDQAIGEARDIIELKKSAKQVINGILILEKKLSFKDFLRSQPQIKRVVYPRPEDAYGVFCNNKKNHLSKKIRGLREEELNQATGLTDAVFCHKTGFMAVCKSLESALILAKNY
jgi:uncharacterized UPF0160 family protein